MKNTVQLKLLLLFFGLFISSSIWGTVTINFGNHNVDQNEEFCIDLQVEDFDDIVALTFDLVWDPTMIEYTGIANPGLTFDVLTFGETKVDEGRISFSWFDAAQGQSLDDGQILFSICFRVIGEGGGESKLRLTSTESGTFEAVDVTGTDVGLRGADANISISLDEIPDNAIFVFTDDTEFSEGESFCIPIRVRNFNDVAFISFSLIFNNNRYRFDRVSNIENWGGFGNAATNTQNANSTGELSYNMFDASIDGAGLSLDDGEAIFELCFTHLLTDESCVNDELIISSNLSEVDAAISDGANTFTETDAPVIDEFGKIRLINGRQITLDRENITPVSCDNPNIGAVDITASGGTGELSYNWSTGATTQDISDLSAGFYNVSISDACLAVDTLVRTFEVVTSGGGASADAGDDMALDCGVDMVTLDGTGSSSGAEYQFDWGPIDGQTISSANNTNQLVVDQVGRYVLTVFNTNTGCSANDTVMVTDTRPVIDAIAGNDIEFTCDDETLRLEGTGTFGINFTYAWSTEDGNITNTPSKGGAEIDQPGTYVFTVAENGSGCFESDTLVVGGDNTKPILNVMSDDEITCIEEEILISAINQGSAEEGAIYEWTSLNGSFVGSSNGFDVNVDAAGTYTVTATSAFGCQSTASISVADIRTTPSAIAGNDAAIDCDDESLTLIGTGDIGNGYSAAWSTESGSIIEVISDAEVRVSSAGTYTFTVQETATGCTNSDDLIVTGNNDKPQASVSGSSTLTCNESELTLNANNGAGGVTGYSYSWSTTDGSFTGNNGTNEVGVQINAPGTYTVVVTNDASACSTPATLTIADGREDPVIAAGADAVIECEGGTGPLTVTSDDMTNVNFSWSVIEGTGTVISGANASMAEYSGPGKYVVTVTNQINGCVSTDTTEVSLNNSLPLAMLGEDYDHCDSETILMGNATDVATGAWTVIAGDGLLEDPLDRNCRVNSLSAGVNTFVWTLSTDQCPDYSSDTININVIRAPQAMDDEVNVIQGFGSVDIDLLANDQFDQASGVVTSLISAPSLGDVTEVSPGAYAYTLDNANAFGTFTFEYEICDELCSMLCDDAMVTIDVRDSSLPPVAPIDRTNEAVSLGITPNGDGLNDLLIFDELIDNPEAFNTKRLLIYNRWGDVVHESMPYQNNWGGTDKSGNQLAQGTYYFVLQLDLGEGVVIEGDITILQ